MVIPPIVIKELHCTGGREKISITDAKVGYGRETIIKQIVNISFLRKNLFFVSKTIVVRVLWPHPMVTPLTRHA